VKLPDLYRLIDLRFDFKLKGNDAKTGKRFRRKLGYERIVSSKFVQASPVKAGNEGHVKILREDLHDVRFFDVTKLYQYRAEPCTALLLNLKRFSQLFLRYLLSVNQQIAEKS